MRIHENGYWMNETNEGHGHDEGLGKAIVKFLKEQKAESVVDFGCGDGYYTKLLNANQICCLGFDGNPHTPELTDGQGYVLDLTIKHEFGALDWALSLEVGEHIPAEFENIFLHNLHHHNRHGIILSWAVPGQGGDGHVNNKSNNEVIEKVSNLGYSYDDTATQTLRSSAAKYPIPCYWFRDTIMVFRRTN